MSKSFGKPLHLIIDGPDKVGKTTLIQNLVLELGLPVIKMPNMKDYIHSGKAEEFSKLFNETIVQFKDTSFIMDRGFTSSWVYSRVFKRKFDLTYLAAIEDELDPVVVILTRDNEGFIPDDIVGIQEVWTKINHEYQKLAINLNYHLVNVTSLTPEEVCEKVLTLLEGESQA